MPLRLTFLKFLPQLTMQRDELQLVRKEIQRTYNLYQQEKLDSDGFSKFCAPLAEHRKQIETALPCKEAELDILKVNNLSAEEIASQAGCLYDRWQTLPSEQRPKLSKSSLTKSSSVRAR
jgi:hypothetical protein